MPPRNMDDNLKKCLAVQETFLAKAFRGELVPQNPNDEPASVLLERIRVEREVQSGNTKGHKKEKKNTKKVRKPTKPKTKIGKDGQIELVL